MLILYDRNSYLKAEVMYAGYSVSPASPVGVTVWPTPQSSVPEERSALVGC